MDISDLKKGIADANQQMKVANAEFNKASAGLENWAKSADGIKAKLDQLAKVLAAQKTKVAAYKEELSRTEKAYEENGKKADALRKQMQDLTDKGVSKSSKEYKALEKQLSEVEKEQEKNKKSCDDLKVTILNQEAAVAKTEKEMGQYEKALDQVGKEEDDSAKSAKTAQDGLKNVGEAAEDTEKKTSGLASGLAKGLVTGLAALGTAAAGAVAGLASLSKETAAYADEINTASVVTGLSTDTLQEYKYAADLIDVSLDTFTNAIKKNTASMDKARDGSSKYAEAYKALGVSVTDADGNLRDSETVFWEAVDALGQMEEGAERDAVAMDLFGKSATDLNPLINLGSEGMRELADEAHSVGAVMGTEALSNAQELQDGLDRLSGGVEGAKHALGAVLMPQLTELAGEGSSLLGTFTNALNESQGDWSSISTIIADTISQAVEFIIGELPKFIELGVKIVTALLESLIASFPSLIEGFTELFPMLLEGAIDLFMVMIDALPVLIQALAENLPDIVAMIVETLIENFPVLLQGAITLFMALVEAIPTIITKLVEKLPEIIDTFITTLTGPLKDVFFGMWEKIEGFASDAWEWIKNIWNVVSGWFDEHVIQPVKNFFSGAWDSISGFASDAWETIKGVWNVVSGWFDEHIITPVTDFFSGLWDKLSTGAENAWEGIKKPFVTVATWFKEKFENAWQGVKDVFSTGGRIFTGLKEGLESVFKTVVNTIIRGINKVVSLPFDAINSVLRTLHDVHFLGIWPFGWVNEIPVPQIPEIAARGGVLKRGQMALLEGAGAEAIVPLEKNKEWIKKVANDMLVEMGAAGGVARGSVLNNNTQNYTQNIYSPKAPSRIEIYRQTRNLLAMTGA